MSSRRAKDRERPAEGRAEEEWQHESGLEANFQSIQPLGNGGDSHRTYPILSWNSIAKSSSLELRYS